MLYRWSSSLEEADQSFIFLYKDFDLGLERRGHECEDIPSLLMIEGTFFRAQTNERTIFARYIMKPTICHKQS